MMSVPLRLLAGAAMLTTACSGASTPTARTSSTLAATGSTATSTTAQKTSPRIALGVYEPAATPLSRGTAVDTYAHEVGRKPAFAWFSVKWQTRDGGYTNFDPRALDQFRTRGIVPGLTWDASKGSALNKNQPDFSWKAIASGKHDAYITTVARAAAAYRHPFILRTLHEMNGYWYPWGYGANGNTHATDYVAAWRHIVDIFRRQRATNVQFAWILSGGIITDRVLTRDADLLRQLYPGNHYVDWIGLDGYSDLANVSRSLQQVFQPGYEFLTHLSKRPIIFFEVGATENPRNLNAKADWITQGFQSAIPHIFPRVRAINWFDAKNDTDTKDFAVDTSPNALTAWKHVVANPLYQAKLQLSRR